jgi:hypothetical protein
MKHPLRSLMFVSSCSLAPVVLGSVLHWPMLLWGFMSMVTASGSLLLVMTALGHGHAATEPQSPEDLQPPTEPEEPPYRETRVIDAALPSSTDGYDFLFSATVWWRPIAGHVDRSDSASAALAMSSVVRRAREVVCHEEPARASFARYLLEEELGVPLPDRSGRVTAQATDVTLALSPADRERLRKLNDLRKDEEIWEYERDHERNKRRYLGDDVLKSTGSAVVWWLTRHEDEIEKAVAMIGPLAQISAAANDEEVPELFRHLLVPPVDAQSGATVGGPRWGGGPDGGMFAREEEVGVSDRLVLLLAALGLKPDMDEYTVFVHRVVRSLEVTGLDAAAEEIRRTLLPMPDEHEDEQPWGGPSGEPDAAGTWEPDFAAGESSPFTETAAGPDADAATFTQPAASDGGRNWEETSEDDDSES